MKVRRSFSTGRSTSSSGAGRGKKKKKKPPKKAAGRSPMPVRRAIALIGGIMASSLAAGYLIAALFVFPAPFIVRHTRVPRVMELSVDDARERLSQASFTGQVVSNEPHPVAPRGQVIWQDPPAGTEFPEGSTVELSVSNGPANIPLPGVAGYNIQLATRLIEGAGLTVGAIEHTQTTARAGVVMNTRPTAGQFLPPGAEVTLVVSQGAPTINVPELLGLTLDSARVLLASTGLAPGTHFFRTSSEEPGTIIEQVPQPGTLSAPGTPINVWIARERRP